MSQHIRAKKLFAGIFTCVLAATLSPTSFAQEPPDAQATPTMIVLDNSGSMTAQDAGNQTRIDAAKQAATDLIEDISDHTDIGFAYYGGNTGETAADMEQGCQDVTIIDGPAKGNADTLIDTISQLSPRGFTPIGKALTDSAAELPEGGNIVLVSDGIANCTPPDVCEVAEELTAKGINLTINTIGLNVDPAAREELECIAKTGGGIYTDASDAQTLSDALTRVTTRQYAKYETNAEKIDGALAQEDAVALDTDTALFATDLGQESYFWKIPVEAGETISVSANTVTDPTVLTMNQGQIYLDAQLHTAEPPRHGLQGRCTHVSDDNFTPGLAVRGIQSATVVSKEIGSDDCDTDAIYLEISRSGDYFDGETIPTEITIERFGKVDDTTIGEVTETTDVELPAASTSEATEATPGQWFDSPTELDAAGEKVTATIVPGETHFYALPVDYGQQLRGGIRTTFSQVVGSQLGDRLYLQAFNPSRAEVDLTNSSPTSKELETLETFGYVAPVSYANMFADGARNKNHSGTWQGGTQYLAVTYLPFGEDEDISAQDQLLTLDYELVAEAHGTPIDPPVFAELKNSSAQDSAPTSASDSEDATTTASSEESNGLSIMWIALGVVALGIIIGLAFVLRKKN
ncbi:hypothetical protein N24_1138 [Corynebacterium suranareeae]|uniref:VWFA domain-containing protein n=1 Tax=Corynebacterium suranareeae TaxID=2506452 RepID=A0A160PSL6_9CORY|nr:VWA domain-containing protein [Corynebacterium suranareeae]BAU95400.1 hypothetical protein N24_1138 [Corynebacterium suranareeae]